MYFMYCTFRSTGISQAKHRAEAYGSPEEDEHGLLEELKEAHETECWNKLNEKGRCGQDWTVEAGRGHGMSISCLSWMERKSILDQKMIWESELAEVRAPAALVRDPCLVPSTHTRLHTNAC